MSYKVEEVNSCTKKFTFSFENLDLGDQITAALKEKQKSANIKGFRKGKAPLSMVEKMYGPQAKEEALNRFVQKEFFEAVDKEDVRVVGYPRFENVDLKDEKSVNFDAIVEIFPEVELKDFSKLSFTKDTVEVTDQEVEEVAGQLQRAGIDGVIATNTTLSRDAVKGHKNADEAGGLSGKPVLQRSTEVVAQLRQLLGTSYPIIAVGGVSSAADAEAKRKAGADLVQIYTGFIYQGPRLIGDCINAW